MSAVAGTGSGVLSDSVHPTRYGNDSTFAPTVQDIRAELLDIMHGKNYIVTLDELTEHFLPAPTASSTKSIPNLFASVPKFKTEKDMYDHFTSVFNESSVFPGQKFVTTAWKSDTNDTTRQAIDCGMYPTKFAPDDGQTAAGNESRRTDWSRIDLCIECKLHSTDQDPFDERKQDNEPDAKERREVLGQILSYAELVFRHQHRTFHYMLMLFRDCARVIRFDHSSVVATEKIRYDTGGAQLSRFLARYGRFKSLENRGHDPTAVRIEKTDDLHALVREYAEKSVSLDPDDHAAGLFKASLTDSWPLWKLKVYDEETETGHWFAVGKPHFQAHGVAGRGTRGYVALPLDDDTQLPSFDDKGQPTKRYVYLKDAWRIDHPSLKKEGLVLKALNAAGVQFVPTVVYHGDLPGQITLSYDRWKDIRGDEECKLKSHHHYRLIVKEVGKPLDEFECGADLVTALLNVIQAHQQACKAGYIHRDISAGNILLYQWSKKGKWQGMLNDWELAASYVMGQPVEANAASECPVLERTGTWQFLSVSCLHNKHKVVDIPDDLESILHVLLYYAVRFLPNNIQDGSVGLFLYAYFDDYSTRFDGVTCGLSKFAAIDTGVINLFPLTSSDMIGAVPKQDPLKFYEHALPPTEAGPGTETSAPSHPINRLIYTLLKFLKDYYAQGKLLDKLLGSPGQPAGTSRRTRRDTVADLAHDDPELLAVVEASARNAGQPTITTEVPLYEVDQSAARANVTHVAFKTEFAKCLHDFEWPDSDKGVDKRPKNFVRPEKRATTTAAATSGTGTGTSLRTGGSGQTNTTKRKQVGGESNTKRRKKGGK